MFGPAAITQDFSEKILKWQAYVGGESTKCVTLKIQAAAATNLRVFVGTFMLISIAHFQHNT